LLFRRRASPIGVLFGCSSSPRNEYHPHLHERSLSKVLWVDTQPIATLDGDPAHWIFIDESDTFLEVYVLPLWRGSGHATVKDVTVQLPRSVLFFPHDDEFALVENLVTLALEHEFGYLDGSVP
jgi:hypothetical protein